MSDKEKSGTQGKSRRGPPETAAEMLTWVDHDGCCTHCFHVEDRPRCPACLRCLKCIEEFGHEVRRCPR